VNYKQCVIMNESAVLEYISVRNYLCNMKLQLERYSTVHYWYVFTLAKKLTLKKLTNWAMQIFSLSVILCDVKVANDSFFSGSVMHVHSRPFAF